MGQFYKQKFTPQMDRMSRLFDVEDPSKKAAQTMAQAAGTTSGMSQGGRATTKDIVPGHTFGGAMMATMGGAATGATVAGTIGSAAGTGGAAGSGAGPVGMAVGTGLGAVVGLLAYMFS